MAYDPEKIEDWVVCSTGFWRKGSVKTDENIVPFRGTWEQVRARMNEMNALLIRHRKEREALAQRQQEERNTLWNNS